MLYLVNKCLIFCILDGLNRVFPIAKLGSFSAEEVRLMLCGVQTPIWTREDIIAYTEPKLGYTRERFVPFNYYYYYS